MGEQKADLQRMNGSSTIDTPSSAADSSARVLSGYSGRRVAVQ